MLYERSIILVFRREDSMVGEGRSLIFNRHSLVAP